MVFGSTEIIYCSLALEDITIKQCHTVMLRSEIKIRTIRDNQMRIEGRMRSIIMLGKQNEPHHTMTREGGNEATYAFDLFHKNGLRDSGNLIHITQPVAKIRVIFDAT